MKFLKEENFTFIDRAKTLYMHKELKKYYHNTMRSTFKNDMIVKTTKSKYIYFKLREVGHIICMLNEAFTLELVQRRNHIINWMVTHYTLLMNALPKCFM
jgi:hypothetical protein